MRNHKRGALGILARIFPRFLVVAMTQGHSETGPEITPGALVSYIIEHAETPPGNAPASVGQFKKTQNLAK